jgi:hypothetical protein
VAVQRSARRLEPLITSPAERSSVEVLSRLPGMNVTSAGIRMRIEPSIVSSGLIQNASALISVAAAIGSSTPTVCGVRA